MPSASAQACICCVTLLANRTTIGCTSRLASARLSTRRGRVELAITALGELGKQPPLARREGEKRIQWQRNAGTNRATCLSMLKRRARGGCRGTRLLTNETTDAAMAYPDASQKRKKPAQGRPGELIQIERKDTTRKVLSGGSCRIRTYDQLVKSQLLYQLS